MGLLILILAVIVIITVLLSLGVLFAKEEKQSWSFFIALVVWSIIVGVMSYSTQPSNDALQKGLCICWTVISIFSLFIKGYFHQRKMANITLVVSTILGIIWIF